MKNALHWILHATALLTFTFFVTACGNSTKPREATTEPPVVSGAKLVTVQSLNVPDTYEAVGTVRSAVTSVIATKMMSPVREIRVKEGDRVQVGQVLMLLDDRDVAAQVAKARAGQAEVKQAMSEVEQNIVAADANRRFASTTYNRFKELYEKKSVSRQEFDEVESKQKAAEASYQAALARKNQVLAKINQSKADVTNAEVYAGYSRITSPIQGIVTAKQIDIGQMASPGIPLLTVEDDSRYRLEAVVEDSQAGRIRLKDPVQVEIEVAGPTELTGYVAEIMPASDPASRSYTVKIDLPQRTMKSESSTALRSGVFGKARFTIGQKQALIVPSRAIVERGQLVGLYVVDDSNVAHFRLVKTGKHYGDGVEILAGLLSGEKVIAESTGPAVDGARVH